MIYFITQQERLFTIQDYLLNEGVAIADRFRLVTFKELFNWKMLPRGVYVFAGIDQLTKTQRQLAHRVRSRLDEENIRCLNHPTQSLLRYPLLEALYEKRYNRFSARPATESYDDLRYPVFIRDTDMHTGSLTRLLRSPHETRLALRFLRSAGLRSKNLIIVDESKMSARLGEKWAIPIEVIPFAVDSEELFLKSIGGKPLRRETDNGMPYQTDQGNYIQPRGPPENC